MADTYPSVGDRTPGGERQAQRLLGFLYDQARMLTHRLPQGIDEDDVAQEAYARALSRGWHTPHCADLIQQVVVDLVRRDRAAKRGGRANTVAFTDQIPAPDRVWQTDVLEQREEVERVLRGAAALGVRVRAAFIRRYVVGDSVERVEKSCGVSAATIRRSKHRVRGLCNP